MIDGKELIPVYNRFENGLCAYALPELHIPVRSFEPNETKKIPMDELRALAVSEGGETLLREFLMIQHAEAIEELIGPVEPEYYYSRKDIEYLLNYGTLDQLEDCINFAPIGVVEMVQDVAVKIKLNDMSKRKLISDKTNKNVDAAIRNNELVEQAMAEMNILPETGAAKVRKTAAPATTTPAPAATARKVAAPTVNKNA